jgi:hypothetical protein
MLWTVSRAGFRFRPPAVELSPDLCWMLRRAFGPIELIRATAPDADPPEVLALCRRFEVSARIAARQGQARLQAELGEAASGFARDQAMVMAGGMRLMALAERVAGAAAALELPLVCLKFAGLELGGRLAPGSRAACDLDVLVPAGRAGELQRALIAGGFCASRMPPQEHQLPALAGSDGVVEVHHVLLGVRLSGRSSATVADLEQAGLLQALPRLPGRAAVLAPAVAAAHTLVHGIAQHGWSPLAYSLLKMVGDLIDLGFGQSGAEGAALAALAAPWVAGELSAGEVGAARRLCAALVAGDDLHGWGESPAGEALLLRHALAGRLDPRYERSLKLGLFRHQPSDRAEPSRLARSLLATLWLSRAQVDAIYGPPRHRLGYLGRRLARPFDLLARLGRYGARALALRRRRGASRLYTPGR